MTITYHGDACLRLSGKHTVGEFTVLLDPYDAKATGLKPLRPSSVDVVASTTGEPPSFGEGPLCVVGPGEYEVHGVALVGIPTGGRTIYRIEAEGISFAHLANIATKLDDRTMDAIGDVDVLFVPIGGHGVLTATQAAEVIEQIEPRIVVPIQYQLKDSKLRYDGPEAFCKEMGCSAKDAEDKLKLTKKDLPTDELWVRMLTVSS